MGNVVLETPLFRQTPKANTKQFGKITKPTSPQRRHEGKKETGGKEGPREGRKEGTHDLECIAVTGGILCMAISSRNQPYFVVYRVSCLVSYFVLYLVSHPLL